MIIKNPDQFLLKQFIKFVSKMGIIDSKSRKIMHLLHAIETIDANDARIETDMIYADKSYAGKDVYLKAFEYVDQEKNQFKNTIPGSQTTKILIIRLGFFCHTLTFHHLLYKSKKNVSLACLSMSAR